jgi:Arc/MetJ-type ribon-helix-helix transcriptional regulator
MMRIISLKLPVEDLRRIRDRNRSEFIRGAVREKLEREAGRKWRPRTPAGRKLLGLSEKFDGHRLDQSAIAEEIRQRRGGLA